MKFYFETRERYFFLPLHTWLENYLFYWEGAPIEIMQVTQWRTWSALECTIMLMAYVPIIYDFVGFSFCLVLQVKLMAWQMTENLINIKNTLLVYKMCITPRIININKGIQLICEGVGEWAVKWCQLPSMLSFPDNLEQHVTSTDTQTIIDIYIYNKWQKPTPKIKHNK